MLLHLGGDISVFSHEIIGVFDIDAAEKGQATKEYLKNIRNDKKAVVISREMDNKSFIITDKCVYFSPISSGTLFKRARGNKIKRVKMR